MEPSIYKAPGPFELETGYTLPELKIAYHTYGKPNAAYDNVVWVCHALTGQLGRGGLVAAHGRGRGVSSTRHATSWSAPTSSGRTTAPRGRCT